MAPRMDIMVIGMARFAAGIESDRCPTCTSETERRSGAASDGQRDESVVDRAVVWTSG